MSEVGDVTGDIVPVPFAPFAAPAPLVASPVESPNVGSGDIGYGFSAKRETTFSQIGSATTVMASKASLPSYSCTEQETGYGKKVFSEPFEPFNVGDVTY